MLRKTGLFGFVGLLGFLVSGADINPGEPLWSAARKGDVEALTKMLDGKVDPNLATSYGATALWFAAGNGKTEAVQLLIKRGAKIDIRDSVWNISPLLSAAGQESLDTVEVLLKAGAAGADELVLNAVAADNTKLLKMVLGAGRIEPETLGAALLMVPEKGAEVRELLSKAGAKPLAPPGEKAAKWKECEGDFEDLRGVQAQFRLKDGYLTGKIVGRDAFVLRPTGELRFQAFGRPTEQIHFRQKDGKITEVLHKSGKVESIYTPGHNAEATVVKGGSEEAVGRPSQPGNWPSFRGDHARGVAEGQSLPASWDLATGRNIVWKTAIPGLGNSSPVVWENRVFLTTAVGKEEKPELRIGTYGDGDAADDNGVQDYRVYCLDKTTGKILWEKTAYKGVPHVKRHTKSSHANPTPATDGKHLVVSFASEGLYCYDLDGKLLWKKDLGVIDAGAFNSPETQWGAASSPILYRDLVIVQCDQHKNSCIAAYRIEDGALAWKTPRDEIPSWGTPTVFEANGTAELVTNGSNSIRGYDPLTGKELWRLGPSSQITTPTPIDADGLILVTSGYRPIQPMYAIRPGARGDISLKEDETSNTYLAWAKLRGGPYTPTPLVLDHRLYCCTNYGLLSCLEVKSGQEIYRKRLGGAGGYSASPVAADGKIYLASEGGEVRVVRAGPTFELLAKNVMEEPCLASPAISEGKLFIRTVSQLAAIGWSKEKQRQPSQKDPGK